MCYNTQGGNVSKGISELLNEATTHLYLGMATTKGVIRLSEQLVNAMRDYWLSRARGTIAKAARECD